MARPGAWLQMVSGWIWPADLELDDAALDGSVSVKKGVMISFQNVF
jgi:hypothetical protein